MPGWNSTLAKYFGGFFDELQRCGVRDVVISPGSRSTPLAMCAYELSVRRPDQFEIHIDVDERGAAFFALGMAKSSGIPVCLIATSGSAPAHYFPAVIEAGTSRVPLIILSADRPLRLQDMGAPQTTDQLNMYGSHVRAFREMPEPADDDRIYMFVRQAAKDAFASSVGIGGFTSRNDDSALIASAGCMNAAGPVQLNFPVEAPLVPDFSEGDPFSAGRVEDAEENLIGFYPHVKTSLDADTFAALRGRISSGRCLILAGEGSCETLEEGKNLIRWAKDNACPVIADPRSGLRSFTDNCIIDAYDRLLSGDISLEAYGLDPDVIIRFGRWPVSKQAMVKLSSIPKLFSVVVDISQTRDFVYSTDCFIGLRPMDFIGEFEGGKPTEDQRKFLFNWAKENDKAEKEAASVIANESFDEASVVGLIHDLIPKNSCLYVANSMSIRHVDSFYSKQDKPVCILCNRGQNGIDGTISSAIGAAFTLGQATLLCGDLAFLHDINAMALQREMLAHPKKASLVIVLMDNNGGAIFDMLPQRSEQPYFERLFLTPQDVDYAGVAAGFSVPSFNVNTPEDFEKVYKSFAGIAGISVIGVKLPLRGVKERLTPSVRKPDNDT
ncbi:MAG: 2-succinyl-5-enolpyruvyl-6-hydroxy-3-cyclohexene-1-carboxylic-acid synthase [Eggerthellaceae bacterium]|nr:2-succinyl-5-enolpyruvyl-6-hydroxy-3-cyclohexene-1-carboxylic-acid synthase [Eggerthellaceae bacterium]